MAFGGDLRCEWELMSEGAESGTLSKPFSQRDVLGTDFEALTEREGLPKPAFAPKLRNRPMPGRSGVYKPVSRILEPEAG
jgi:hypothetical protein